MSTNSPNMNLPISTVNVDSGLLWETNLNAALSIIDGHDHSPGNGVPIPPSGINLSSDLTFQGNSATNLKAVAFTAQASVSTLDALYVKGVDLYYNDGSSNVIQMTSGGLVNATSSGISSGSASASFVSSVLVVNAASTTPADIQGGSLYLGNNTAGSKFLKLSPPNAMAANYTLSLPTIPGALSVLTIDASGNIAAGDAYPLPAAGLASNSVTTAKILDGAVTPAKLAALGQQLSASCSTFTTASTSLVDVTNLSITITTTGRPVMLMLIADGSGGLSQLECVHANGVSVMEIAVYNSTTSAYISKMRIGVQLSSYSGGGPDLDYPVSSVAMVDVPAAGTYTYKIQARAVFGSSTVNVYYAKLLAYEL